MGNEQGILTNICMAQSSSPLSPLIKGIIEKPGKLTIDSNSRKQEKSFGYMHIFMCHAPIVCTKFEGSTLKIELRMYRLENRPVRIRDSILQATYRPTLVSCVFTCVGPRRAKWSKKRGRVDNFFFVLVIDPFVQWRQICHEEALNSLSKKNNVGLFVFFSVSPRFFMLNFISQSLILSEKSKTRSKGNVKFPSKLPKNIRENGKKGEK